MLTSTAFLVSVALCLVVAATTVVAFVRPATDVPAHADAVVVLDGSGPRLAEGVALASAGVAPVLVVSTSSTGWLCPRLPPSVTVICITPDPLSTQGEARFIGAEAKAAGWHRIVVVSSTPQVSRAEIRVARCYPGTIDMVGVSPGGLGSWLYGIAYEWAASFKALFVQPGC